MKMKIKSQLTQCAIILFVSTVRDMQTVSFLVAQANLQMGNVTWNYHCPIKICAFTFLFWANISKSL